MTNKIDTALGTVLILALLIIIVFAVITGLNKSAEGYSYMKGNNTVANVSAIHDLNNESDYDSPVRLTNPHPEMEFHEVDWDCRLYGECSGNITESQRHVVCPDNFDAETMHLYYRCNN